jgi:hypothetical protein
VSNSLTVLDMVAARALKYAHENAKFIKTIDRQFDESYNSSTNKSKNGTTLRVRNPNAYTRRTGSRVMDVQDTTEATQTITVGTQDGVDMRFNSAELAQSIDYIDERYIAPAMGALVSGIDGDAITQFTKDLYNQVGTAGTVVGSSSGDISAIHNARARLNQGLAPVDGRTIQMDSVTMAAIANGNKAIFNPTGATSDAFKDGSYGRIAGADIFENERTWSVLYGSDVTADTDNPALVTDGGTTVDMHTLLAVAQQKVGMTFTITGVYACHPETKQSLGYLQQYVITAVGATTTTVSPAFNIGATSATAAKRNVCKSDSTALATTDFDAKTLVFGGAISTSYRQNLMYHKDAFAFVTAELPLMDDAAKCVRITKDGLSLRVWQASDIRNDEMLVRIDILYGFKTLRPEWGVRITN